MLHSDYYVSDIIMKQKIRSGLIMGSIESRLIAKKNYEEKILKQKENQEWLILLIKCLKEMFAEDPKTFSRLEIDIFSHWGKYKAWQKSLANDTLQNETSIYLLRTFELVYTDILRKQNIWPEEMLIKVWAVIEGVYQKYEECTGRHIIIIRD